MDQLHVELPGLLQRPANCLFGDLVEHVLELIDHLFLVLRHHVERFEVVGGVDAEVGPLLSLVGRRDLTGVVGQVTHMPHRGLHPEILGQEATNGAGLRGALNDDQGVRHRQAKNRFPLYRIAGPPWRAGAGVLKPASPESTGTATVRPTGKASQQ